MNQKPLSTNKEQLTPIKVLFVCLGNICRSPMAEAVFKHLVAKAGLSHQFHITSGGTGDYHVGKPAHPGTRRILSQHGIHCDSIAEQVRRVDLEGADYIVAMDRYNLSDLRTLAARSDSADRLHLLLNFMDGQPGGAGHAAVLDVPDPYYTHNFEETFRLVQSGCQGLLAHIRRERGI